MEKAGEAGVAGGAGEEKAGEALGRWGGEEN